MTTPPVLDIDFLKGWIERVDVADDVISPRLARELHATLDKDGPPPGPGEPAPSAMHWCLAPPAANTGALGPDGHPARGGFLPPVPLPRRMWASSRLQLHDPLRVGDRVERRSVIADVTAKTGRSGTLCFVDIDHESMTTRGLAITERQTIVYRAMEAVTGAAPPPPPQTPMPPLAEKPADAEWHRDMIPTTTLLFRYSALTFNGHRIHYDRDYARDVEGYPGLLVQGPLQATLLLDFATEVRGHAPRDFAFRGVRPLFDGTPCRLCAQADGTALKLWIETGDGARTMEAEADWRV